MNKYLHFSVILNFVKNSVQIKDFYNFFQKKVHLVTVRHYMDDSLIIYYSIIIHFDLLLYSLYYAFI